MTTERVTEGELLQAMRRHGANQHEHVEAVVLESDGSFSVVPKPDGQATVLTNVVGIAATERL